MKLVKKWLFPALTCLIVAGAVVLPPYLSQLRDARQLGQVHTELLEADALPANEPPKLLDRLTLYARWSSSIETIPSFRSTEEQHMEKAEQIMQEALNLLAEGGVIPVRLTEGSVLTSWSYILLWNPESSIAGQQPVAIWRVSAEFGPKSGRGSLLMDVDAESGLSLGVSIYHDNMAQWLPHTLDDLQFRAEQYFALLGLDMELMDATSDGLTLNCTAAGTNISYWVEHNGTMLNIQPALASYGPFDAAG